ncbi:MAG TPA: DNA polymerase III subunit alpha, partial [Solimonas sp.]|nr:DNA polymerase III subunit alpha [Solimonas sp.]
EMEPVLQPTYGIFVYQEQVMQMSQRLAGYSLGGADLLRRAMGKKIAAEMAKQRGIFTEGAIGRGVEPEIAGQVFDLMEKFANYGFNKSHAAAYALVSYQTAWLKTHYPAEFMAAVLSCEMQHTDAVVAMLDECRRMGLKVHAPDINSGEYRFTVPATGEVRYGLGAIKGVGEGAVESIILERRANGPFRDLFDFCRRIDTRKVNKRVLEALIYCGALDGLGLNRASLLKTLPKALQLAEAAAASAAAGQNDLFGLGGGPGPQPEQKIEAERETEWPRRELLNRERETLGFYLSGHPIESYRELVDQVCSGRLRELLASHATPAPAPSSGGKPAWQPRTKAMFAAWVIDVRFFKGDKAAEGKSARASFKVTLDDQTAQIATWIDAEPWQKFQSFVKPDSLVFVIAEIGLSPAREGREAEPRLYAPEFLSLDQILRDYAARLSVDWKRGAPEVLALRKQVQPWRDPQGVSLTVNYSAPRAACVLDLPGEWRLRLDDARLLALQQSLGADCVKVQYKRYQPPASERRFSSAPSGAAAAGYDDE